MTDDLRTVRLCFLGFGSVARGLCALLQQQERALADDHGLRVVVTGAGTRRGSLLAPDGLAAGRGAGNGAQGGAAARTPAAGQRAPRRLGRRRARRADRHGRGLRPGRDRSHRGRLRARHGRRHREQGAHRLELGPHRGQGGEDRPPHPLREYGHGRPARLQPARVHARGLPPARLRRRVQQHHQLHHRRDGARARPSRRRWARPGRGLRRGRPEPRHRRLGRRLQGGGAGERGDGRRHHAGGRRQAEPARRAARADRAGVRRRQAPAPGHERVARGRGR